MSEAAPPSQRWTVPHPRQSNSLLPPGEQLAGRYRLLQALGKGGMGTVYEAFDPYLEERIALKVLHNALALSAEGLSRFRREVKLARRVTHINVARVFDLGIDHDVYFLTMELVEGASLALAGRQSLPESLRIAREIARGLCAAHAAGVVHRDLKPDNVLMAGKRVVITDFGIACAMPDPRAETQGARAGDAPFGADAMVGTLGYMAPEQIEGSEPDGRADIFALGVVLFELLTGRLPFEGPTAVAMLTARLLKPAPDVREFEPNVPAGVAELIRTALARKREERLDAHRFLLHVERLLGVRGGGRLLDAAQTDARQGTRNHDTGPVQMIPPALASASLPRRSTPTEALGVMSPTATHVTAAPDTTVSGPAVPPSEPLPRGGASQEASSLAALPGVAGEDGLALGPEGRAAHEMAERACASFDPLALEETLAALQALPPSLQAHPRLQVVAAKAHIRLWMIRGTRDPSAKGLAEDLLLRAIDRAPSLAEAYHLVSVLRFSEGDARAHRRGLEEALRRAPSLAVAHADYGHLACETGMVRDGLYRLDIALRLDPNLHTTAYDKARTLALLGERAEVMQLGERIRTLAGPLAFAPLLVRLPFWWRDRLLAARVADDLGSMPTGAAWDLAVGALRAYAEQRAFSAADDVFRALLPDQASSRHVCMVHQMAAEYFCLFGREDLGLRAVEAARDAGMVDLLWMDRCGALSALRGAPRFAEARAMVAARAMDVWA